MSSCALAGASMPCAGQASHETVARALTLLRPDALVSLVRRRLTKTGRILGNLYVLRGEPLTPFEAMQLRRRLPGLVSQSLGHAAKSRSGGVRTQHPQEVAGDPMLSGRTAVAAASARRALADQGITATQSYPQEDAIHDSEERPASLLQM